MLVVSMKITTVCYLLACFHSLSSNLESLLPYFYLSGIKKHVNALAGFTENARKGIPEKADDFPEMASLEDKYNRWRSALVFIGGVGLQESARM